MKIGRNKVLAAIGAVMALLAAVVGWWAAGTTGLLVVILTATVVSTAAIGALVAVSERRVHHLMGEHHRNETLIIRNTRRDVTKINDRLQAEHQLVRDELASLRQELGSLAQEASIAGRDMNAATQQFESAAVEVAQLAAATGTAHEELRSNVIDELTRRSRNEIVTNFRRLVDEAVSEFDSLQRLHGRFSVTDKPPALGGWAIGPGALLYVLELVEERDVSLLVECGPGASTVYIAEYFRRRGHGRVVSVEHDEQFFSHVTSDLARRGLSEFADVRFAPLVDVDVGGTTQSWYDPSAFADLTGIDLLLVDGPPQATGKLARYPAVPVLSDRLSSAATVIVDDAFRPGEQAAMARWQDELGWTKIITPPGGFVALRRSGT